MKPTINVNMTGEEFIKYKKSSKLSSNKTQATLIFSFCLVGILIVVAMIDGMNQPPTKPMFQEWYKANQVTDRSWNDIAKHIVYYAGPWIIFAVMISWVLHGTGFYVVR